MKSLSYVDLTAIIYDTIRCSAGLDVFYGREAVLGLVRIAMTRALNTGYSKVFLVY